MAKNALAMTRRDLYDGMVRLAQEYGYTNEKTYELIHRVIDSIGETDVNSANVSLGPLDEQTY